MRRPLFVAGTAAFSSLIVCMTFPRAALAFVSGAVFLLSAVLLLVRRRTYAVYAVTAAAVFAVFALLFEGHMLLRVQPTQAFYGRTAAVEGVLKSFPEQTENSVCFTLENCTVNGTQTRMSVRVYTNARLDASPGDAVCFPAARFFEESEKDEDRYHTLSSGVWLSAYGRQGTVTAVRARQTPRYAVETLRHKVNVFFEASLPELYAKITSALLTGEGRRLPADFKAELRTAGASHLFAVSGMHLSLWAGVFFLFFRRRAKTRIWANLLLAGFVLFYMFFTGCSPSVVRAGCMLLCACFGRVFRRFADPLNTLGAAALVQFVKNPFLAGNISFLLSFAATAAIFTLYPYFSVHVGNKRDLKTRLFRRGAEVPNMILLSLCVLVFTVPVSSVFFSAVSLLSPVSSLLCSLPAEGVMLSSALAAVFSFSAPVSGVFLKLCGICCGAIVRLVEWLSSFDFALCPVRGTSAAFWFTGTVCVCAAVYFLSRKKAQAVLCVILASASLALLAGSTSILLGRNKTALVLPPAGNAVTAALVFENSTAVLIGTGETYENAALTAHFLAENGVTAVKTLIVPTADRTAAGQQQFVAQRFHLQNVFSAEGSRKYYASVPNFLYADAFSVTFRNGVSYKNIRTAAYTAGLVTIGEFRVLFAFSPGDDFSGAPDELCSADVLVCRAGIPKGLDAGAFGTVYVQTDKTAAVLRLPSNARAVTEENGVILTFDHP
ncbi:MAG: ComEC/Rec2 family competence protein [Clostridia bacterium]|nr:ComEC/Rec2 family competence protein [Clostridia bacterium]